MGIVDDPVEPYRSMQGLHLYHAPVSNCAQRVRIALEEKGVDWTSHLVDLAQNQHLTAEYQKLHPGGVVPALVHDGRVVIESNDIIRYVDERFPGPALLPDDSADVDEIERLLEFSADLQSSLRLLSFLYLFDHARKTPEQFEAYAKAQRNSALVEWHRRFNNDEFTVGEIAAAVSTYQDALRTLDNLLAERPWLTGASFGIADIAWAVNVRRAELLEQKRPGLLQLDSFERLGRWYSEIRSRPAYQRGLVAWEPGIEPSSP